MPECTILIIDDDEDDIGFLTDALAQCGVETVHCVSSAEAAFVYLDAATEVSLPQLIVTDHFLPRMTGNEFLKDLRSKDKYKHIPVIALSTYKSPRDREQYRQFGALEYMDKPNSYQEYLAVAEQMKRTALPTG